jgi:hypothetical protein
MFRIAESMARLGATWPDVQDAFLRAWEFRPTRVEPLHAITTWYRTDQRYRLGYLYAASAAQIPLPAEDILFVDAEVYQWRAVDEQAVCASWIGKYEESFTLCRDLLARRDLPDGDRQRIAGNRDLTAPQMIDAASSDQEVVTPKISAGQRDSAITVSLIASPDLAATERTLTSFLHCCIDASRVGRFLVANAGLGEENCAALLERYPFLEFGRSAPEESPGAELATIRSEIEGQYWLHICQDWRFFAPDSLIGRLTAVLEAEPEVFQVGINVDDATKLTGTCAAESTVRRADGAGRYLLGDVVATGPAMFETARLDRAGGIVGTDRDPVSELGRRATAAGLQTATLDEVLCIAG